MTELVPPESASEKYNHGANPQNKTIKNGISPSLNCILNPYEKTNQKTKIVRTKFEDDITFM